MQSWAHVSTQKSKNKTHTVRHFVLPPSTYCQRLGNLQLQDNLSSSPVQLSYYTKACSHPTAINISIKRSRFVTDWFKGGKQTYFVFKLSICHCTGSDDTQLTPSACFRGKTSWVLYSRVEIRVS